MDEQLTDEVVEHIDRFSSHVSQLRVFHDVSPLCGTGHYLQHQPSKGWMNN